MGRLKKIGSVINPRDRGETVKRLIEAQNKIVPEMMNVLVGRYNILKYVKSTGPIGRRPLGEMLGLSERETRTSLDFLREHYLIHVAKNGATITEEGDEVLASLATLVDQWSGRKLLEHELTNKLGIQKVKVVSGNSETEPSTKTLLGVEAAAIFTENVKAGQTIAVTGGSTVASIPSLIHQKSQWKDLFFIAARGGVGDDIGLQANVIAASFAEATGGMYDTFYYPESLSEEAHVAFQRDPSVKKMIEQYNAVDGVIHGIGNAKTMATMREATLEEQELLKEAKAKGEAFGYYFDRSGKAVHKIRTVGIQTEQLQRVPFLLAVAGGKSKAEAILSYIASAPSQTILVTDEGAANEMLRILTN